MFVRYCSQSDGKEAQEALFHILRAYAVVDKKVRVSVRCTFDSFSLHRCTMTETACCKCISGLAISTQCFGGDSATLFNQRAIYLDQVCKLYRYPLIDNGIVSNTCHAKIDAGWLLPRSELRRGPFPLSGTFFPIPKQG